MSLLQKIILAAGAAFIFAAFMAAFGFNDFKFASSLAAIGSLIGFISMIVGQVKVRQSEKHLRDAMKAIEKVSEG